MGEWALIGYRVVRERDGARQWLSGETQEWHDWPCDLWDPAAHSSCILTAKAHGARVAAVYLTVRKSRQKPKHMRRSAGMSRLAARAAAYAHAAAYASRDAVLRVAVDVALDAYRADQ